MFRDCSNPNHSLAAPDVGRSQSIDSSELHDKPPTENPSGEKSRTTNKERPRIPSAGKASMEDGEREKLDRLMRRYIPKVFGVSMRLTGCQHRAEDLVQETMLRAIKNWSRFRGDSNPETWLYAIVVNVFRDNLKSKQNQQEPLDSEVKTDHDGPAAQSIVNELGQAVAKQVSALPPRQREVLVLMTYEGLSVAEVGEVLEMKPSNIYTTLHHARNTLREKLQPFMDSETSRK